MKAHYLVEALATMPALAEASVRRLPETAIGRPTGPGRFSPVEVLAHLADWEPIFRGRMEQAFSSPGLPVEAFDESERADSLGYSGWDLSESLAQWSRERAATAGFLGALPAEGWSRTVLHPERGELTVLQQAATLLGHDVYHLVQLEAASG